ncbi:MAG TPA: S8 family serine peptidase [Ignavibacteria bacterium]|nr:S8 family serine peptidase [Ignavibacteria bacterium]
MKIQSKVNRLFMSVLMLFVLIPFLSFDSPENNSKIDLEVFSKNYEGQLLKLLNNHKNPGKELPDWTQLDPEIDGYEGTRTKSFYKYLKTLSPEPVRSDVIVAVIDSGFDIDHPDLNDNVWQNSAEVNGVSGIDDDENGYVDDFNGWNFLGNAKHLPYEFSREYFRLKKLNTPVSDPYFIKVEEEFVEKQDEIMATYKGLNETLIEMEAAEDVLRKNNITTDPKKLQGISMSLPEGKTSDAASIILGVYLLFGMEKDDLAKVTDEYELKSKVLFDSIDVSELIGDDPLKLDETNYGNNDVTEKDEEHGTHVSGVIASRKTGHAPYAKIMFLRAVPNEGDERDKDVGNAIRYAVDNGASIINMSAGKYFSPYPEYVVDAVKYAEEKGVLFVISAGNEGDDVKDIVNYPRKYTEENGEKKYFDNMIVVGASSWMKKWSKDKDPENKNAKFDLLAPFSNYSDEVVDVFAPGVQIYSTIPGGKYKSIDGTSMASPSVTGVAAVLKSYYPQITAFQLKEAILSSVRKYDGLKVKVKDSNTKYDFSKLSKSGGVIDMLNAYKVAGELLRQTN